MDMLKICRMIILGFFLIMHAGFLFSKNIPNSAGITRYNLSKTKQYDAFQDNNDVLEDDGVREIVHLKGDDVIFQNQDNTVVFKSDFDLNGDGILQSDVEEALLIRPKNYGYDDLNESRKKDLCVLCQSRFEQVKDDSTKIEILELGCTHFFHKSCLDLWQKAGHDMCPTCKYRIGGNVGDSEEVLDISLDSISLATFIKIVAEKKKMNYWLHKDLATIKPSLKTYKAMSVDRAWELILTLLEIYGYTHVVVGDLHKFLPSKEAVTEPYPLYSSVKGITPDMLPDSDQVIRYIYALKNIKADMANSILGNLLGEKQLTVGDFDVLIIKDSSRNIKQAMKIIRELDVGGMRQSIAIMSLRYTEPEVIAKFLNEDIIAGKSGGSNIRFWAPYKKSLKYFSSDVRVIPYKDKRMLIFLGQQAEVDRIIHFVKFALDIDIGQAGSRIHIKEIRHHSPADVQRLLQSLISGSGNNSEFFKDIKMYAESATSSTEGHGSGSRLIVACGNDDWKRISEFIDQVDKPQPTLAVEIMIVDASLDLVKQLSGHVRDASDGFFGDNIGLRSNNFASTLTFDSNLPASTKTREYPLNQGLYSDPASSFISIGGSKNLLHADAWGLIKAQASQTNSSIIYQPYIVTTNNQEGKWASSEDRRTDGDIQSTGTRTIRRRVSIKAATNITLTPRINLEGVVDLSINIRVSEFKENVATSPDTTSRNLVTKATLGLGEVLALGGFDSSKLTRATYKVPFLSSIPIIGLLFKNSKKQSNKTQLYMFLRVSVIKQQLHAEPDDYTALKVKYAKYQVDNINSYAKSQDPIEQFFFKPRKSTIQQTMQDYKNDRFSYIDEFVERKETPISANMLADPYYNSGRMKMSEKNLANFGNWSKQSEKNTSTLDLPSRKAKKNVVTIKEIKVSDSV